MARLYDLGNWVGNVFRCFWCVGPKYNERKLIGSLNNLATNEATLLKKTYKQGNIDKQKYITVND